MNYEWDFGDGNQVTGEVVTHSYSKSGIYKVVLSVTDNLNTLTASTSSEISVFVNEPPVAVAGEDLYLNIGLAEFDCSYSYYKDGSITQYLWNFGDGNNLKGAKVTHLYQKPGKYEVELPVIDNSKTKNNSSSSTLTVFVNTKPVANAGKNLIVAPGEKFNFISKRVL